MQCMNRIQYQSYKFVISFCVFASEYKISLFHNAFPNLAALLCRMPRRLDLTGNNNFFQLISSFAFCLTFCISFCVDFAMFVNFFYDVLILKHPAAVKHQKK